jgi:hypothetical protein
MLQLDVLKARLDAEYSLPVDFEISEFQLARWISSTTERSSTPSWRRTIPALPMMSTMIRLPRQERVLSRLYPRARRGHRVFIRQGCEEEGVSCETG